MSPESDGGFFVPASWCVRDRRRTHDMPLLTFANHTTVIGWRGWIIDEDTGLLRSSTGKAVWWPGRALKARCLAHLFSGAYRIWGSGPDREKPLAHLAPDLPCSCGVSAYRRRWISPLVATVVGTVRLGGAIVEEKDGYRAAHGYPERLYVFTDGALDGESRATAVAETLGGYGVPVDVLSLASTDDLIADRRRSTPIDEDVHPSVAALVREARASFEKGELDGAIELVLAEIRRRDLSALHPGHRMDQGLPGPAFLHSTHGRRWVSAIDGPTGQQILRVTTLGGAAGLYYGPSYTRLDTATGDIEERFEGCCGPLHRGHSPFSTHRDARLTVSRVGPSLRLETWIQVLLWTEDRTLLSCTKLLRESAQ